jgi:excisionase family DNA binding protein
MTNLIVTTPEQLASLIDQSVRKALAEHTPKSSLLDDQPINIDEAAAFIKKPKSTIYQMTSTRKIPFNKVGKQLLFFRKDLLAWIEESKKKTKKEIESEGFSMKGGMKK